MIFGAIGLLVALSGSQDPSWKFSDIVPHPTGRNGYEEYVRAARLCETKHSSQLESYVSFRESKRTTDPRARPSFVPKDASLLTLYRIQCRELAPALALIRAGNNKVVEGPWKQLTPTTLLPELAGLKRAAKVFRREAELELSEGNSDAAVTDILQVLRLGWKIAGFTNMHYLVGSAVQAIGFSVVQQHIGEFKGVDLERLQLEAASELANKTPAISAANSSASQVRGFFDWVALHPAEILKEMRQKPDPQVTTAILAISKRRREQLYEGFFSRNASSYKAIAARLTGSEATWLRPLDEEAFTPPQLSFDDARVGGEVPLVALALVFYGLLNEKDDAESIMTIECKRRIRLRLLDISCKVARYRLIHGSLPDSPTAIADLQGLDPITGTEYRYEKIDSTRFRISNESKQLGLIELETKRTPPQGVKKNPTPL